jgi:predicted TIM-barrel fold metal-dependent hydrolase
METVDPRMPAAPGWKLPNGVCDCHAHVFGPYQRFPLTHPTPYAPPLAPPALHREMLRRIGASHGVLIQPGAYGTDPAALLAALQEANGALRGIAAATASVPETTLTDWNTAGVRGLRFVEMRAPSGTGRYPGSIGTEELETLAPRLRHLGWHAEVWATMDQHAALLPRLRASGVPVVLDHLAGIAPGRTVGDPAFQAILDALGEGWLWVKLTLCRASREFPDYPDIRPFHDALIAAAPERLVWGSDWPHVRMGALAPDVGHLLDLFGEWVRDPGLRDRILVHNPAALYGFGHATTTKQEERV